MLLDVAYCIVPWYQYDVCERNSLRGMTIISFLLPLPFACNLHRPSHSFLSLDGRYVVVYYFQVRSL